jgi:catechol 2,3-dioxygenase-like lactoylglutathione lyase family enzyme
MKPSHVITGLYETHLHVADLARSMQFYGDILGLELALRDAARALAFYWIGAPGRSFVGLWEKPKEAIVSQHLAFEVSFGDLERGVAALRSQGVPLTDFSGEATDVPSVFGWIPAASIYFDDPDGHLLELIARLPGPPRPERAIMSLPDWLRP